MRILVTGATGFIGNKLVEKLIDSDYAVHVFSRKPSNNYNFKWSKDVISIQGDLTNKESICKAVKDVDAVIHLAAQLGSWWVKESYYYDVNVEGTKNLVEEAKRVDLQHFIYISTAGVFGKLKQIPANELHPCLPRYPYEKTKYMAERYITNAASRGFPATVLRPSHVYGPGDLNTVPLLRLLQKTHFFPLIGGGNSFFQPVYIDDLIEGIILALKHPGTTRGKLYTLAGNQAVTFKEYFSLISKILGMKIITLPCPYALARLCAQINEFVAKSLKGEPILTNFRVDFFGGHQCYDIGKAQHDFRYSPKVNINDGMIEAINWYEELKLIY